MRLNSLDLNNDDFLQKGYTIDSNVKILPNRFTEAIILKANYDYVNTLRNVITGRTVSKVREFFGAKFNFTWNSRVLPYRQYFK